MNCCLWSFSLNKFTRFSNWHWCRDQDMEELQLKVASRRGHHTHGEYNGWRDRCSTKSYNCYSHMTTGTKVSDVVSIEHRNKWPHWKTSEQTVQLSSAILATQPPQNAELEGSPFIARSSAWCKHGEYEFEFKYSRLPKPILTTFDRIPLYWQSFWNSYLVAGHGKPSLSDI